MATLVQLRNTEEHFIFRCSVITSALTRAIPGMKCFCKGEESHIFYFYLNIFLYPHLFKDLHHGENRNGLHFLSFSQFHFSDVINCISLTFNFIFSGLGHRCILWFGLASRFAPKELPGLLRLLPIKCHILDFCDKMQYLKFFFCIKSTVFRILQPGLYGILALIGLVSLGPACHNFWQPDRMW